MSKIKVPNPMENQRVNTACMVIVVSALVMIFLILGIATLVTR